MADNAERLADGVGDLVLRGLNGLTGDLVCPSCIVAEYANGASNIGALCPVESLADVESFDSGELIAMLLNEIGELVKKPAALVARAVQAPGGVEGFLRCLDCDIDIFAGTLGYPGNDLVVCRVDHTEV